MEAPRTSVDVIVVGAGFAGLYMLHRARSAGFSVHCFEAGAGVGGTWFWNRYPGARCDVPSLEYSYEFDAQLQQEWNWSEKYSTQPEILRYIEHVAQRFELLRDITFNVRVTAAVFDEAMSRWTVTTNSGEVISCQFLVMATGCLSSPNIPKLPREEVFNGKVYHTGQWPTDGVDFTGQRVAVIGTGSSGVQSIPIIARQAQHLTVLQRTAAYCVPARNAPLDTSYVQSVKDNYKEFRQKNRLTRAALGGDTPTGTTGAAVTPEHERRMIFEERWQRGGLVFQGAFNDTLTNRESNELFADFVREKISSIVKNQSTARVLMPKNVFGCKRLCVDNGYYETFNRENVALVDLNEHVLEGFTANGVIVGSQELPVDAVVFATGFDAMTGALNKISITGRNGQTLRETWSAGPVNYLGLGINGFPNLFTITGPGSPSVLTNMLVSIQHHVEWITDCLSWLRSNQHATIEVSPTAQDQWVQHVNTVADATLYQSCSSWYLGANVPGKPRVFMPLPGFPAYVQRCADVARENYLGFLLD